MDHSWLALLIQPHKHRTRLLTQPPGAITSSSVTTDPCGPSLLRIGSARRIPNPISAMRPTRVGRIALIPRWLLFPRTSLKSCPGNPLTDSTKVWSVAGHTGGKDRRWKNLGRGNSDPALRYPAHFEGSVSCGRHRPTTLAKYRLHRRITQGSPTVRIPPI